MAAIRLRCRSGDEVGFSMLSRVLAANIHSINTDAERLYYCIPTREGRNEQNNPQSKIGNQKNPRQRPTLPHRCQCSTIGEGGLSFRVRNENGRGPSSMATGKFADCGKPQPVNSTNATLTAFGKFISIRGLLHSTNRIPW